MSGRTYEVWYVDCDECGETTSCEGYDAEPIECPVCGEALAD